MWETSQIYQSVYIQWSRIVQKEFIYISSFCLSMIVLFLNLHKKENKKYTKGDLKNNNRHNRLKKNKDSCQEISIAEKGKGTNPSDIV